MATVLLPLPARDFDSTEVPVSWRVLVSRGHNVVFATPGNRNSTVSSSRADGSP